MRDEKYNLIKANNHKEHEIFKTNQHKECYYYFHAKANDNNSTIKASNFIEHAIVETIIHSEFLFGWQQPDFILFKPI